MRWLHPQTGHGIKNMAKQTQQTHAKLGIAGAVQTGREACSVETCSWVLETAEMRWGEFMNLFGHHKFEISRRNWALYGSIYHTFHFSLAAMEGV